LKQIISQCLSNFPKTKKYKVLTYILFELMSIKLLLVEGSAYQRILFSKMLSTYKSLNLIDVVRDGKSAAESILKQNPDVMVIDIETSKPNDIEYIRFIMKNYTIPIIFLIPSDYNMKDSSLKEINSKAFDLIVKPNGVWKEEIPKIEEELTSKIILVSKSKIDEIHKIKDKVNKNVKFE